MILILACTSIFHAEICRKACKSVPREAASTEGVGGVAFGHWKQMAVPRGEGLSGQGTGSLFTADQRLRGKSGSGKQLDTNDKI